MLFSSPSLHPRHPSSCPLAIFFIVYLHHPNAAETEGLCRSNNQSRGKDVHHSILLDIIININIIIIIIISFILVVPCAISSVISAPAIERRSSPWPRTRGHSRGHCGFLRQHAAATSAHHEDDDHDDDVPVPTNEHHQQHSDCGASDLM